MTMAGILTTAATAPSTRHGHEHGLTAGHRNGHGHGQGDKHEHELEHEQEHGVAQSDRRTTVSGTFAAGERNRVLPSPSHFVCCCCWFVGPLLLWL